MKRKFFAIMLAFVMCFAVAGLCIGCASKTNDKTAYELWLEDGHSGTMDDFYNWLSERGEQGPAGEAGAAGVGIESAELNEEGKLVIKFTDGKSTTIAIPAGPQGEAGAPGAPGADGNGIESIELEGSTIVITYTNGDTVKLPYPTKECAAHNEERVELVPHTQEKPGVNLYVCNECGLSRITRTETIHVYEPEYIYPTCTEDGYTANICTVCGHEKDVVVDEGSALDHDWKKGDEEGNGYFVAEPGKTICVDGGFAVYVCGRCDAVSELTPVGPQGHNVAKYSIAENPSASEEGLATGVCDGCGETIRITLPKLSDTEYKKEVVLKTELCTGALDTNYTVWVNWTVNEESGKLNAKPELLVEEAEGLTSIVYTISTAKGNHSIKGTVIGATIDVAKLEALGGAQFEGEEATCTTTGKGYYTCDVCGKIAYVTTNTVAHTYDEKDVVVIPGQEPGCTDKGKGKVDCTVCNQNVTVDIDPTGHPEDKFHSEEFGTTLHIWCEACSLDEYLDDYWKEEEVAANCSEAGYVIYGFKVDGEVRFTDKITRAALGHALYVEHVEDCDGTDHSACYVRPGKVCDFALLAKNDTAAEFDDNKSNCGKAGKAHYECVVCGKPAYVETRPHGEHEFDTEAEGYKAPTCTETGSGRCEVCGLGGEEGVIPALGHDYKFEIISGEPTVGSAVTIKVTCGRKDEDGKPCCYRDSDVVFTVEEKTLPVLPAVDAEEADRNGYTIKSVKLPQFACAADAEYNYSITVVMSEAEGDEFVCEFKVVVPSADHTLSGKPVADGIDANDFIELGGKEFEGEEATCSKAGHGYFTCEVCGKFAHVATSGESRHDYGTNEIERTEPTCDEPGNEKGYCVACNDWINRPIPALGHVYNNSVVEVTVNSKNEVVAFQFKCTRTFGEEATACGHVHNVSLRTLAEDAIAEEPIYTEDLSAKVEVACNHNGRNEYTAVTSVTDIINGKEVVTSINVRVILITPALPHTYDEETVMYNWTSTKTEKLPVLGIDEDGDPVLLGYKDVAVTYEYEGYLCEDCYSMIVIDTVAHINGKAIVGADVTEDEEYGRLLIEAVEHACKQFDAKDIYVVYIEIEEMIVDEAGEPVLGEDGEIVTEKVAYELIECSDCENEDCLGAAVLSRTVIVEDEAPEVIA